jgi:hypothetical protein
MDIKQELRDNHAELDNMLSLAVASRWPDISGTLNHHRSAVDRLAKNLNLFPDLPVTAAYADLVRRRADAIRG